MREVFAYEIRSSTEWAHQQFAPVFHPNTFVDVSAASGNTRVLLTHSRQVAYEVRALDDRIEILYAGKILVQPERKRLDDPILPRFTSKGDERLVLHLGRAYRRHEHFELNNPFRLIIDLYGAGRESMEGALPECWPVVLKFTNWTTRVAEPLKPKESSS